MARLGQRLWGYHTTGFGGVVTIDRISTPVADVRKAKHIILLCCHMTDGRLQTSFPACPEVRVPVLRRRETLTAQLIGSLTERINRGELQPGDRLPTELALIEEFKVSRTVVREAISSLRATGLVSTRQGVGAFVRKPGPATSFRIDEASLDVARDVIALLELRIGLETEAASLAAQRRETRHLARMAQAMARMDEAIDAGDHAVGPDFDFHIALAEATLNPHFPRLFSYLGALMIPRSRLATFGEFAESRRDYLKRANREHAAIHSAIEWGDPDQARSAMRIHLSNSRERLRNAIERPEVDAVGPLTGPTPRAAFAPGRNPAETAQRSDKEGKRR